MTSKPTESLPCGLKLETYPDGQVFVEFISWAYDEEDGEEKIHSIVRHDGEEPVDDATRKEIEALAEELAGKLKA